MGGHGSKRARRRAHAERMHDLRGSRRGGRTPAPALDWAPASAELTSQADDVDQVRSCIRKISYSTPEAARRVAVATARRAGHSIAAYGCRFCGRWHIGGATADGSGS